MVQVHNTNSEDVYIPKNTKLGLVQKYEEGGCYLANSEYAHLAAKLTLTKQLHEIVIPAIP